MPLITNTFNQVDNLYYVLVLLKFLLVPPPLHQVYLDTY